MQYDEQEQEEFERVAAAEEVCRRAFVRKNRLVDGAYYWLMEKGHSRKDKPILTIGQYYGPDAVFSILGNERSLRWHEVAKVIARIKEPSNGRI